MGCCSSVSSTGGTIQTIHKTSTQLGPKPEDLKPPPAVESIRLNDKLLERMRQVSAFKCLVVSPMTLHNHLVYAREAMKAQEVLIFNINSTSELEVADKDLATSSVNFDETKRLEDFMSVDDGLSSQTLTEGAGGAISA